MIKIGGVNEIEIEQYKESRNLNNESLRLTGMPEPSPC